LWQAKVSFIKLCFLTQEDQQAFGGYITTSMSLMDAEECLLTAEPLKRWLLSISPRWQWIETMKQRDAVQMICSSSLVCAKFKVKSRYIL
jgi:hypothetical protein